MLERKIDKYLTKFFKNYKQALLITGARQVGKTFSIRRFGKSNFESFIEINFIKNPEYKKLFEKSDGAEDLLFKLSTIFGNKLIKGKTLVFFDEVQVCKEIVTAIKFLVEEGSFRYILSGSLLGVEIEDISSVPVGYMVTKEMYPLCLEEFFLNLGVGENVIDAIYDAFKEEKPLDSFVHNQLMRLLKLYIVIGGMPEAVTTYIKENNIAKVNEIHTFIIKEYLKDIAKYDKAQKLYLNEIFKLIPGELASKNKRFILKNLNEGRQFSKFENSFIWLKEAGVALPTFVAEDARYPLLLSKSTNLFKLFQSDVGLLSSQYGSRFSMQVLVDSDGLNIGAVYENLVAQEFHSNGFDLYYYNKKKVGEVDFLIEKDGVVYPIEVKSGKDYTKHVALNKLLEIENLEIKKAYVLSQDNVKTVGNVVYLPLYMAMCFIKDENPDFFYSVDIAAINERV